MILSLSIRNFVLIKDVSLMFTPGLNVITGVTGGGKSLVLRALDFLLGGRPSPDLIYQDEKTAEVTGVFSVSPELREMIG